MFESLTRFIPKFENFTFEESDNPLFYLGVMTPTFDKFISAVYKFVEKNPDFDLKNYQTILRENREKIISKDVSNLDAQIVLALIFSRIRAGRFDVGFIEKAIENGEFKFWLLRLKEIDEQTR